MCKTLPWWAWSGASRTAGALLGGCSRGYHLFIAKPLQVLRWRPDTAGAEWEGLTIEQAFARLALVALLALTSLIIGGTFVFFLHWGKSTYID